MKSTQKFSKQKFCFNIGVERKERNKIENRIMSPILVLSLVVVFSIRSQGLNVS